MAEWTPAPLVTLAQAGHIDGQLLPSMRDPHLGGLASLLLRLREARSSARGAFVLVACGNLAGGSETGDLARAQLVVRELAGEGLVALVPGEREMALGLEGLRVLADSSSIPLLSANLMQEDGRLVGESHVVLDVGAVRVALIGLSRHPPDCAVPRGLALLPPREALLQVLPAAIATSDAVVIVGQFATFDSSSWSKDIPQGALFLTTSPQGESPVPRSIGASWTIRAASPRSLGSVAFHVASDGTITLVSSDIVALTVQPGDSAAIEAMATAWAADERLP